MDLKTLLDTPPWEWPQGTGKRLQKILNDPRAIHFDRLAAAELAGDITVINDQLAGSLLTIAGNSDEPDDLRARAAIALGPILELAETDLEEDPDDVPISPRTFRNIKNSLERIYSDNSVSKELRRRVLEASVRAPQNWHRDAIETAYSSGDGEWMLTAVFSMHYVRGFDERILEALNSADPEIQYEAVRGAGNWGIAAAWSHVTALVNDAGTPKALLLAAIEAVSNIRPAEARSVLSGLADSGDEEIAETAEDAILMGEAASAEEDEEDADKKWVN